MAVVYMLGDSHTQALGPRVRDLLSEHDVITQAFPGYSTARAAAAASIPASVDLAIVALGGNDFGTRDYERAQLVQRLRTAGARVLWFGPATATRADVDARHLKQTQSQRAQLPALGVRFYDSRPWTTSGHRADGVHFTSTGYSRWASNIADAARSHAGAAAAGGAVAALALVGVGYLFWRLWRER